MTRLARIAFLLLVPAALVAQQPEVRVDAFWTTQPTWHIGAGLTWRLGNYIRATAIGGRALTEGDSYRGELIGRATLDPFRRRRVALSIGGGLGIAHEAYLIAIAELEGPAWKGISPAFQAGVGRGYRAGVVLRRAIRGRR
jgi:hypothetical protein